MATTAVSVAERLIQQGIGVTVIDPRWVKPWDRAIVQLAREHDLVVCVEDNGIVGGCGSTLLQLLNSEQVETRVRLHGIPQEFLDHAKRDVILERIVLMLFVLALAAGPHSPLERLFEAVGDRYQRFTHAMSMP